MPHTSGRVGRQKSNSTKKSPTSSYFLTRYSYTSAAHVNARTRRLECSDVTEQRTAYCCFHTRLLAPKRRIQQITNRVLSVRASVVGSHVTFQCKRTQPESTHRPGCVSACIERAQLLGVDKSTILPGTSRPVKCVIGS